MTAKDPRESYAYRKARRAHLDKHKRQSGVCDKCGHPMDYGGKGRTHRRTATIEHQMPIETHPELALDPTLWNVWCLSCNSAGNRNRGHSGPPRLAAQVPDIRPEREW